MLFLKYVLLIAGLALTGSAAAFVCYDVYISYELARLLRRGEPTENLPMGPRRLIRWRGALKLAALASLPLLLAQSIIVIPDGAAGVRISQISGVRAGTLYPGVHLVTPLVDRVAVYDVRDHVYATAAAPGGKQKEEVLEVEAQEGLPMGLAVAVRYRIDPSRLDFIQSNLPQPVEAEIVAPIVTSTFRELAPNYRVREAFSTKREEFRSRAAGLIAQRLSQDAIAVKEVLLRQVKLPEEYARGLEGLLLKEQEDERTTVEAQIEQKRVQVAQYQAEQAKIREIKRAEADAQARVIQAKAESDAMQYTLPLKQKQIEQTRLEAQARKEATVENAEAEAQAKIIDSKAEQQRRTLLAQAEADRIRLFAAAEAEQMRQEAAALKANPLLIQKIVAEKLSDKVQIMMVPMDGKFFFANDVFRSAAAGGDDPPQKPAARP